MDLSKTKIYTTSEIGTAVSVKDMLDKMKFFMENNGYTIISYENIGSDLFGISHYELITLKDGFYNFYWTIPVLDRYSALSSYGIATFSDTIVNRYDKPSSPKFYFDRIGSNYNNKKTNSTYIIFPDNDVKSYYMYVNEDNLYIVFETESGVYHDFYSGFISSFNSGSVYYSAMGFKCLSIGNSYSFFPEKDNDEYTPVIAPNTQDSASSAYTTGSVFHNGIRISNIISSNFSKISNASALGSSVFANSKTLFNDRYYLFNPILSVRMGTATQYMKLAQINNVYVSWQAGYDALEEFYIGDYKYKCFPHVKKYADSELDTNKYMNVIRIE